MSVTPGQVGLQPDGSGQKVDVVDLTNPLSETVVREIAALGDPGIWAAIAAILNSNPTGTEYALVVRPIPSGTQPVSGTVNVGNFPATQPVSGTVTANAGTNLNTSALALESGGNLAGAKSDLDSLVTHQTDGTQKTQVTNFPATQPVSGSVTANAGTNLNTSALALETGGNLAAAKADLDSIVTNTTGAASAANQTNGNQKTQVTNFPTNQQVVGAAADGSPASGNPVLMAFLDNSGNVEVPDLTTAGALKTDASATTQPVSGTVAATQSGSWNVGTTSATVNVGQQTSNTTAVQISSSSTPSTNGILVQGLSANTASVYVGGSGVTTATGFELQPGQAAPFTCSNITALYVIGSNSTDKVCWNVL